MKLVFEGAPATGKSTVARHLAEHHGFFRVAEVNELFPRRPNPEPEHWYCERQLDRCRLAREHSKCVLDGDPLQAVWFSWMYPELGFADWSESLNYLQSHETTLVAPTFYVHLRVDETTRYERERDRERMRGHSSEQLQRKWERYADFTGMQTALVDAMSDAFPGWVVSLEAFELEETIDGLLTLQPITPPAPTEIAQWLGGWLSDNRSSDYR